MGTHVVVEIGSLREPVEIIEPPRGGRHPRVGRIRHANGENVAIDFDTLRRLERRAEAARLGTLDDAPRDSGLLLA